MKETKENLKLKRDANHNLDSHIVTDEVELETDLFLSHST